MKLVFGFSKRTGFNLLSSLIRLVTNRPFSHAYVKFVEPNTGATVVFQASGLSVNMIEYGNFLIKEVPIEEYQIEVPDQDVEIAFRYMYQQLGTNYGSLQLILDLIYIGFRIKLPFKSTGEVCSEQAARLAKLIGLDIQGDPSYCTPSDLNDFCKANMVRIL